jgi:hypothetical protein
VMKLRVNKIWVPTCLCNPPTKKLPSRAWPAIDVRSLSRFSIVIWWVSRSILYPGYMVVDR